MFDNARKHCQSSIVHDAARASGVSADAARRRRLLDAALSVFLRFGYRKTSMDEIARAAGVSRQGLYLHFATKEELFRGAVQHFLQEGLEQATARLEDEGQELESRLVGALDAWTGRFVGVQGGHGADLAAAAQELVGPLVAEHERAFVDVLTRAVRASGLVAAYRPAGLGARQLADTLYAVARGLKHSETRADLVTGLTVAVRALCFPLRRAPAA